MNAAGPVGRFTAWNAFSLMLGLAFLYTPILLLVVFSFNASRLVTVWGGFSTEWYAALIGNTALREAAGVTIRVGLASAVLATFVGTLIALVLARPARFLGRGGIRTSLFTGAAFVPMILPEVMTGLSLLLLFVSLGIERGQVTVTLAHATLSMSFVAVVVQARLSTLDESLEEAAKDLGATPRVAFLTVTLPLIAPSVAAGFLLAFTLSLDDLVLASFTSGPGATTLPMRIYSQARLGVTPEINAASTVLIAVVAVALVVSSLLLKRAGHRAARTAPVTDAA